MALPLIFIPSSNSAIMVIFPGWYAGEHGRPAYVVIIRETQECIRWLPIPRADKYALIAHLPLSASDQALCWLTV